MKTFLILFVALAASTASFADDIILETRPLIESPLYDDAQVKQAILSRIQAHIYDGYTVDLCIDDPKKCESVVFAPYKTERNSQVTYSLRLKKGMWNQLPSEVQEAVVRKIIYYTWGHSKRQHSPLDVSMKKPKGSSPLDLLSPHSKELYLKFSLPKYLVGGLGSNAYGPNCWYNSIAAIADKDAPYAARRRLTKADWSKHRFMGPTEFRFHMMNSFEEVATPEFGDVVRYYTDEEIYTGMVFGGEIHATVYIGREVRTDAYGITTSRDIALTKNGRSDLDFLIFQDVEAMDGIYLAPLPENHVLLQLNNGKDPRKKGYFRVKEGTSLLDLNAVGVASDSYAAFLIDRLNYRDRWECLAGRISPPPGGNTSPYSYPRKWLTLSWVD